ncbi:hypothetical protein V8C37DRAFT_187318 [Trichoderma ceciliae]
MEEIYQKLSVVNLWQGFKNSNETSFEVIEAWLQHESGRINMNRKTVYFKELDSWLAEETDGDGETKQSLVLRIALIGCDIRNRVLNLSDDVMRTLLNAFDLELAYKYSQSCITNVSAIPPLSSEHQAYSFCYMPKLAAVWAHHRFDAESLTDRSYLTQGLIFFDESNMLFLSEVFRTPWSALLYQSPMFPAFLLSLILSTQIHQGEERIKLKVRASERCASFKMPRQGYDKSVMSLFVSLAAEADGCAVKLGSLSRKSKMVEKALKFMLKNISEQGSNEPSTESVSAEACQLLRSHVLLLQDRLEMQVVDIEYTLKRVQLQIGMLAGIISRGDFQATLILAESQHRDSLSMKTLAIVTMVFLPGSFISALFSTSMFDWDSVDPSSSSIAVRPLPQFRLYWAITIPLTIATFLLFFFWIWMTKLRHDAQKKKGDEIKQDYFDRISAEEKAEMDVNQLRRLRKDTEFTQ